MNRQEIFAQLMNIIAQGNSVLLAALKAKIFKRGGHYFIQPDGGEEKQIGKALFRAELHAEAARIEEEQKRINRGRE